MSDDEGSDDRRARQRSSTLEWVAGSVGLGVTLTILGYLGSQALTQRGPAAAIIVVDVERISDVGPAHVVEIVAHNRAPSAVAAVEVEGTLTSAEGTETSAVTFDYIPGGSSAHGGLHFSSNPRGGSLELRSVGHVRP